MTRNKFYYLYRPISKSSVRYCWKKSIIIDKMYDMCARSFVKKKNVYFFDKLKKGGLL